MATEEEAASYPSFSKEDFESDVVGAFGNMFDSFKSKSSHKSEPWTMAAKTNNPFDLQPFGQNSLQVTCPPQFHGFTENNRNFKPAGPQPQVNLRNVLGGLYTMVTRAYCKGTEKKHGSTSGVSFLGSDDNGNTFLSSSVYLPSAPPLLYEEMMNCDAYRSVLEADPPEWLSDSSATDCMKCKSAFSITRGRHHCRFCGGIFCRACSKSRCLLPVKFRERAPQRVCDECYDRLDPLQEILISSNSNAVQSAKHDVMDWTCGRGWLNLPVGLSMEYEIYKAANALRSYSKAARLNPEDSIPQTVLKGASGLAILTVVKAGAILTYKLGTGLVVARNSDGSWSAPSSILSVGLGWGAQIGGELIDFILVLRGPRAVKTFCSNAHISLGGGLSVAAGPVGRVLEADLRSAGDINSGGCYTYSYSKGAFIGVSLEGNIVATRRDANLRFYGDSYMRTEDLLMGVVNRPKAADPLYSALDELYTKIGC